MFNKKPSQDYFAYQEIASNIAFNALDDTNSKLVIDNIIEFSNKYPKSRYNYHLWKDLILGLRCSIDKNIDINIVPYVQDIGLHLSNLQNSNYYRNDSIEHKKILQESYQTLIVYLCDKMRAKVKELPPGEGIFNDPLVTEIIQLTCKLPIIPEAASNQNNPAKYTTKEFRSNY
jgi:hypothetical protein